MVTLAVRSVFRNYPVFEVTEIGLEFIPTPIENYTNDKSAMDAYIRFVDNKGGKHIIAIETKYTDVLGVNEASRCEEQKQMLVDTGLPSWWNSSPGSPVPSECRKQYRPSPLRRRQ